ncbi:MAG: hypothetical protein IJU58_02255, partial [Clostridia bacterium]|nr:hypothetical protein [Clostridia bacterium]
LKYKLYLDESEKDIVYAVKKIRNSVVHGRYIYDPTQEKYVLYDQAKNKTSYNELSTQQKALVDKCIKNNLGSKKIKNLESFAVLSLEDLLNVFYNCCGFSKPKRLKHNTLANTITNIIETQKQTQNTLVLKQKNSK